MSNRNHIACGFVTPHVRSLPQRKINIRMIAPTHIAANHAVNHQAVLMNKQGLQPSKNSGPNGKFPKFKDDNSNMYSIFPAENPLPRIPRMSDMTPF